MRKTKILCLLVCLAMSFAAIHPVYAVTIKDHTSAIPVTGSQVNGISITKIADGTGGGIMLEQYALSTLELSSATYFAIKYYNPNNAAWPFYFICQQNGAFIYLTEGTIFTLTDENFQKTGEGEVQYSAIAPSASGVGYVIIPASAFSGLATIEALYITLPATSAAGVSYHFEKLAYTVSENPDFSADLITLTDFSAWTNEWFAGRETNAGDISCAITKAQNDITGVNVEGLINGVSVMQTAFTGAYNEGGLMVNRFEGEPHSSFDISNVEYIAFEMANPMSVGMAALLKLQDSAGNQATPAAGTEICIASGDFSVVRNIVTADPYTRLEAGEAGWVIIPSSAFAGLNGTVAAVYCLIPSYDASLNGASVQFGRIAVYTEAIISDYSSGEVVADPYSWTYNDYQLRIASTADTSVVSVSRCTYAPQQIIPIGRDFGDVRILEDLDAGYPETESEFNAFISNKIYDRVGGVDLSMYAGEGISGKAMKVDVVTPKDDRPDDYAGITFTGKTSVNRWSQWLDDDGKLEGITFFVKNLSPCEVSLCFEIDEYDPDQNIAEDYRGERWSIGLGGRILLYDTVTGKESLINATPTFNLPCGFTGWVRIPVSCFVKPAWCTWGNSTLDLVRVPQFTIAINTQFNMGASFVLDDFGLYYAKTTVRSIFFDNDNCVSVNMGMGD